MCILNSFKNIRRSYKGFPANARRDTSYSSACMFY
jgi:hypothetical protein